jgi:hypothetical protein
VNIILKLISRKSIKDWNDMAQDRDMMGFCERGNEPWGSIK